MTRLGFRSLGLPLAITGTASVGLTPTMMSPFIVRTRTVTAAVPYRRPHPVAICWSASPAGIGSAADWSFAEHLSET
jgi:hypothetical protein